MAVAETGQGTQVADDLMSGVEHPQLHQLVRRDVLDQLNPHLLPSRSASWEVVLQHPLGEWLADHRPDIVHAELLGQSGPVSIGGARGDAVHHRVREGHRPIDPVCLGGVE
jgi:hypothetical protein